jgi:hypothetical protein
MKPLANQSFSLVSLTDFGEAILAATVKAGG